MDFDEWHHEQLNGDPDNCPHEKWERYAWEMATTIEREACAKLCDEQAKLPECPERAKYCADAIRSRGRS